uniref:Uncharacterized protein n=1 Tax=Oryza brachyantha TaxID=4533 RepID=J3LX68_ORYBR
MIMNLDIYTNYIHSSINKSRQDYKVLRYETEVAVIRMGSGTLVLIFIAMLLVSITGTNIC